MLTRQMAIDIDASLGFVRLTSGLEESFASSNRVSRMISQTIIETYSEEE